MENLTGKQFGPYQIVAPLGEGGMAAVYKAYQASMERYVALKVLPRHLSEDPQFISRFEREAKILAQLQHPHILPIFDFGQADGHTYIVMPFVHCGVLADSMKGKPLPLSRIRQVVMQVGDALNYAHARGLIHRDIKPSNVLVDEGGNCSLTDLGLARMTEKTDHLTRTGAILGTPAYMSPEQGAGEPVDSRSDIYALGVILYELVTGRVPYKAETPIGVIFKHLYDPLPPARELNPSLPEAVHLVLLKALAKSPQDRYQTAGEMVRAIQAAIPENVAQDARGAAAMSAPRGVTRAPASGLFTAGSPGWKWALAGTTAAALTAGVILVSARTLRAARDAEAAMQPPSQQEAAPAPAPAAPPPVPYPSPAPGEYLVVDLSEGPDAQTYPVSKLGAVPAKGWTDEFKTDKLVLRVIEPGSFVMGSPEGEMMRKGEEEKQHPVTLTRGFYIGVFETTQKQWERVMGSWPSAFYHPRYRDTRPVEQVSYEDVRGTKEGAGWPATNSVDAASFMGRLRAKTGLVFDLPTEAQWEYACRAGTTTALSNGKNLNAPVICAVMAEVGRYKGNAGVNVTYEIDTRLGTAKVGSYPPNPWGLYDMHGNLWERCLDWMGAYPDSATDPQGPATGDKRVSRSGSWTAAATTCRSAARVCGEPSLSGHFLGFRAVVNPK